MDFSSSPRHGIVPLDGKEIKETLILDSHYQQVLFLYSFSDDRAKFWQADYKFDSKFIIKGNSRNKEWR